jgi:hypothetical protein
VYLAAGELCPSERVCATRAVLLLERLIILEPQFDSCLKVRFQVGGFHGVENTVAVSLMVQPVVTVTNISAAYTASVFIVEASS